MKRTALVTGANRGLGLAIARRLAALGNAVLLGSRDLNAGEEAAASLRNLGLEVAPVHLDLADSTTIDAASNHVLDLFTTGTSGIPRGWHEDYRDLAQFLNRGWPASPLLDPGLV